MKTTVDYSDDPAAKHKAVEDIREYLGNKRYETVVPAMKSVSDPHQFQMFCSLAGIHGFPVRAWYDHFHGEGAFDKATGFDW